MRIDKWGTDQVMRLPDWCFGRRFPVFLYAQAETGTDAWDIAELGLPERCVLWEILLFPTGAWAAGDSFRLALGDQLPTTIAIMSSLDPLLHGMGETGPEPRNIHVNAYATMSMRRLRMVVESAGRRPILEVSPVGETTIAMNIGMVFSAIPREVPDWLISGQGKNQF